MKFYTDMKPIDRLLLILDVVRSSVAIEGMVESVKECNIKIIKLKRKSLDKCV